MRALWSSDINIKLTAVRKKTPKTQKTAKHGMQVPSKIGHFQWRSKKMGSHFEWTNLEKMIKKNMHKKTKTSF